MLSVFGKVCDKPSDVFPRWAKQLPLIILMTSLSTLMPVQTERLYAATPESKADITLTFAPVVKKTLPAVVNIFTKRTIKARTSLFGDPLFDRFFQRRLPLRNSNRQASTLGSGVIIDSDGMVITNNHVIEKADAILVALSDGSEYEAEIILQDEASDLAVLQMQGTKGESFPKLEFGDSDKLEAGDLVLAIGNPFGVGQTVTMGIVSAAARSRSGINDSGFFIQTDAAINPGNSGGALIDSKGRLVGVNTAIYSRSGGSIGIGFAIPANLVKVIAASAKQGSNKVSQPWLGAQTQSINHDLATLLHLQGTAGAIVTKVIENSPSERAGLEVGDIIIGLGGGEVSDPDSLGYHLRTLPLGGSTKLSYLRDGEEYETELDLEELPDTLTGETLTVRGRSLFAGATLAELSPLYASLHNIPSGEGLVITEIEEGSSAEENGLLINDVILEYNNSPMVTISDFERVDALSSTKSVLRWRVAILREGQYVSLSGIRF